MSKPNSWSFPHIHSSCGLPHLPPARPKNLGFTPLFLSHPIATPSANSNSLTLKIYPEFYHFPPPSPQLPPWSYHHDFLPGWWLEHPVSNPESSLHPATRVILRKCRSDHVCHSRAQNPSGVSLSFGVEVKDILYDLPLPPSLGSSPTALSPCFTPSVLASQLLQTKHTTLGPLHLPGSWDRRLL